MYGDAYDDEDYGFFLTRYNPRTFKGKTYYTTEELKKAKKKAKKKAAARAPAARRQFIGTVRAGRPVTLRQGRVISHALGGIAEFCKKSTVKRQKKKQLSAGEVLTEMGLDSQKASVIVGKVMKHSGNKNKQKKIVLKYFKEYNIKCKLT